MTKTKGKPQMTISRNVALVAVGIMAVTLAYFALVGRPEPPSPEPVVQAGEGAPHGGVSMDVPGGFPTEYADLVEMGNNAMDGSQFAIAAEAYRRALQIDDTSLSVRTDFGACLHGMGLQERALEELRKVIEKDPFHVIATFNMGIVHYTMQNADSARVYLERCLEFSPGAQMEDRIKQILSNLN